MMAAYKKGVLLFAWCLLYVMGMSGNVLGAAVQEIKAQYALKEFALKNNSAPIPEWQRDLGEAFRKKWVVNEFPGYQALLPILQSQGLAVSVIKGDNSSYDKQKSFLPKSCVQKITPLEVSSPFPLYFISKNGFLPFNIVMKVPGILSLNDQGQKHLYHMILSVGGALKQMGYADYYMFVDFSKSYGEDRLAGVGYVEFIPEGYNAAYIPGEGRTEDVFVDHKIKRTGYALFRICMTSPGADLGRVKEFERIFRYKQQNREPGNQAHSTFPWKGGRKNYADALKVGVYQLMTLLQNYGILHFEDLSPTDKAAIAKSAQATNKNVKTERVHNAPQTAPSNLQKEPKESMGLGVGKGLAQKIKNIVSELSPNVAKRCAFCNPTILERQKVYTSPISHILYNFRPYFDNGHFMIVPKEHKDNFQDITWPEFQDMYQEAQCLTRMAKDAGTVHWFVQNGPQAGQTQPHIHFHVLWRNKQQPWEFFVHLALELSGASKTLTAQDYDHVREKVRPFCDGKKAFSAKAAA